jgi:hypothetical protein
VAVPIESIALMVWPIEARGPEGSWRTPPTPGLALPGTASASLVVPFSIANTDPTGSAALDPRQSQIRRAARRASVLIEQAPTLEGPPA